jgi:hypothetical protein
MSETSVVRCLTVRQPWAWAIMEGVKDVENREWATMYRGPLFIHAAVVPAFKWAPGQILDDDETELPPMAELEYGAILGVVDLVDCVPADELLDPMSLVCCNELFVSGPYCWMLENPRRLEMPVMCKGQMGLWRPPPNVGF